MKTVPNRIVIYPKDVANITGQDKRTARRLLARIRKQFNKPDRAYVSIDEFCAFTGLKEEKVAPFLL